MKAYLSRVKLVLATLAVGLSITGAKANESTEIGLNFGLVFSSGYQDTLDEWADANNMESTGGSGWLDLGLRVDVSLAPGISIVPAGDILLNFVAGDESAMNMIFLPSVSVKYQFGEVAGPYVQAGLNYGIVNMGIDGWDEIESDGLGFQIQAGYRFERAFAVELGYVMIPVSVEHSGWDEDFGGIQIRGAVTF